jgi:hypothetical protein
MSCWHSLYKGGTLAESQASWRVPRLPWPSQLQWVRRCHTLPPWLEHFRAAHPAACHTATSVRPPRRWCKRRKRFCAILYHGSQTRPKYPTEILSRSAFLQGRRHPSRQNLFGRPIPSLDDAGLPSRLKFRFWRGIKDVGWVLQDSKGCWI